MPCLLQSCYHFRDELLVLSGLFNKYLHCLLYLACSFSCAKRNKLNRPQRYKKYLRYTRKNQRFLARMAIFVCRSSRLQGILCSHCELARRTYSLNVHWTLCGTPLSLHGCESVKRVEVGIISYHSRYHFLCPRCLYVSHFRGVGYRNRGCNES